MIESEDLTTDLTPRQSKKDSLLKLYPCDHGFSWKINQQGNVELIAKIPNNNPNFGQSNHKCLR